MDDQERSWADVDRYFADALVREDDALVGARESGADTTLPHAEVAPNQGALLNLFVQMCGARRVLEFGTLAGYSTIWLARAVGEGGLVVTLELSEKNASIARANLVRAGVADRVEIVVGAAVDSARSLTDRAAEPFDLFFIDADKPSNPAYLKAAIGLAHPGSVIVVDNVVRRGRVIDTDADDRDVDGVRALVELLSSDPRLEATALQTVGLKGWDGFILARVAGP